MTDLWVEQTLRAEAEALAAEIGVSLGQAIRSLDERISLPRDSESALLGLDEPLPESGSGAQAALDRLMDLNARAGANTGGPRCFHFVIGGSTPAALGADLLATAYETLAYTWVTSPLGVMMELKALAWLRELFGLALQGIGRGRLQIFREDSTGRLDTPAYWRALEALDDLNTRLGEAVLADGRFLVGTSKLGPRTIFRPAFSNWRTRAEDIDEFVVVIRELGTRLIKTAKNR
jgi:glutamate/tyrosine decarboxylase-like PLP-dependent enzyme